MKTQDELGSLGHLLWGTCPGEGPGPWWGELELPASLSHPASLLRAPSVQLQPPSASQSLPCWMDF